MKNTKTCQICTEAILVLFQVICAVTEYVYQLCTMTQRRTAVAQMMHLVIRTNIVKTTQTAQLQRSAVMLLSVLIKSVQSGSLCHVTPVRH